jgi:hypothetical protein
MADRATSRSDDLDDIAAGGVDIDHVGAINPGMSATDPLFTARADDHGWIRHDDCSAP